MSWGKEVMPVRPAALTNWLVSVITRLDSHVGNPAFLLPLGQMLADELFHDSFTAQVVSCDGTELIVEFFPLRLWTHPVDSIKTLLKDVVWARLEVAPFPEPKLVAG